MIGYGFAVCGPDGEDGLPPKDLDACNGREGPARGYRYHATAAYPYLVGAYRRMPVRENFASESR